MHLQQLKGRPKQGMWKGLHEWKVYERGNFSVKNGIWKEKGLDLGAEPPSIKPFMRLKANWCHAFWSTVLGTFCLTFMTFLSKPVLWGANFLSIPKKTRLFKVPHFSLRPSTSSALRYWRPSWFHIYRRGGRRGLSSPPPPIRLSTFILGTRLTSGFKFLKWEISLCFFQSFNYKIITLRKQEASG